MRPDRRRTMPPASVATAPLPTQFVNFSFFKVEAAWRKLNKDEQENRLALLANIRAMFLEVADVSLVEI